MNERIYGVLHEWTCNAAHQAEEFSKRVLGREANIIVRALWRIHLAVEVRLLRAMCPERTFKIVGNAVCVTKGK